MKRSVSLAAALLFGLTTPAFATFHIMVVDQVFLGLEAVPQAQYVTLRMQAPVQTQVFGQPLTAFDAAGAASSFAAFCSTPRSQCNLPVVSPACKDGGCPNAFDADGKQLLIATPWAQGLFCVTADLLAIGTLSSPSGRVCFGDCSLRTDCGDGPVDCVAYGDFTGDNGIFGTPAASPPLGSALSARPQRTNQFLGGNLLDSAAGFETAAPAPANFHGDQGALSGTPGDADGNGRLDGDDPGALVGAEFAGGSRCVLPAAQRGADANLDTRVSAADLVSLVELLNPVP